MGCRALGIEDKRRKVVNAMPDVFLENHTNLPQKSPLLKAVTGYQIDLKVEKI